MTKSSDPAKRKRDMSSANAARTKPGRNPKDAQGFTHGERAFVLHYLGAARRNATEAANLAGYSPGNRLAQGRKGYLLLRLPHVIAEIDRVTIERNERLSVTADDVLRDLVILKTVAELQPANIQSIKARREILKDIGEHVAVGAFRRQVGLSSPAGGPIETVDLAMLAHLSDEELDQLERARGIIDRMSGKPAALPDSGADTGGEGTPPQGG